MAALPPGLDGNFRELTRGGDDQWMPFEGRKLYTNAFIVQNGKVKIA